MIQAQIKSSWLLEIQQKFTRNFLTNKIYQEKKKQSHIKNMSQYSQNFKIKISTKANKEKLFLTTYK